MSAPKIIYITPAPEGGFVEFWAEHPSAARGDVAYIPQKGATKMQAEIDALKAELAELKAPPKVLKAEDVEESGFYWWREGAGQLADWDIVEVGRIWPWEPKRFVILLAGEDKNLFGEFIGPIQMPEA